MPISDSSPERRNLILISLAFILFYAAEGRLHGEEIRLFVINLRFSKPEVLIVFAWALLFWFALRFYQKVHLVHRDELWNEIMRGGVPKYLSTKACRLAREQLQGSNREDHYEKRTFAQDIRRDGHFGIAVVCNFLGGDGAIVHQEVVDIGGLQGFSYRLREVVSHAISGNAVAEYLIPYILFVAAALGPLWGQSG